MRRIAAFLLMLTAIVSRPAIAQAQVFETVVTEEIVTESIGYETVGSDRFVEARPVPQATSLIPRELAQFGPFRVLDDSRAAMIGVTDARSPEDFARMLDAFPGIAMLELIDCPGTEDDIANLKVGRLIRAHGITTYVPPGGSVRSGAVELFLAGARRYAAPQAEFAVHAWMDDAGREADDYAPDAPENAKYLAYYRQMGMSAQDAIAFYAMTNSVPFESARWLTGVEMAGWVALDDPAG